LDIGPHCPYNTTLMNGFDLAIVDLETTGTQPAFDRIIEVGVLKIKDGALIDTYSTLVDPERMISYHIASLTGITNKDLSGAPTFSDIKDDLFHFLDGCVFVAHNARFDYGFLRKEFEREGMDFSAECLCTARLSRKLFPHERRHGLDSIMERFGISCQNRHRALDDAQVLRDFLDALHNRLPASRLMMAMQELLKSPTLPPHIDQTMVKTLPDAPGVYVFYDAGGGPLYVGKSINIRNRVLSHFSSDHKSNKEMSLCQQVRDIKAIKTAGELGALLLESHLIKELYPIYNRRSLNSKKLVQVKRILTAEKYLSAEIEHLNVSSPPELPDILGIFRTKKKAKEFLWSAAKEHGLCPKIMGLEKGNSDCFSAHLDICRAACTGAEAPASYNNRFMRAFTAKGIRSWPFPGPILIEEKNGSTEGDAFLIDQWCIVGSCKFDETGAEKFLPAGYIFDYDSYKILVQFLLSPKKPAPLKQLTYSDLRGLLEKFNSA
jgi:DNA polymerase-3 subunit epsilon